MNTGIRILDSEDDVVSVRLQDILNEIYNGNSLHWSILYFYGSGELSDGKSIPVFEEEVNDSKSGLFIKWQELNELSKCFNEIIDIRILGCKDLEKIYRYEDDREMYEVCDIFIEMFDSCFWEVFSNDPNLIKRLATKFKEIEFLKTDFLK